MYYMITIAKYVLDAARWEAFLARDLANNELCVMKQARSIHIYIYIYIHIYIYIYTYIYIDIYIHIQYC